jgi:hypothetical protein
VRQIYKNQVYVRHKEIWIVNLVHYSNNNF